MYGQTKKKELSLLRQVESFVVNLKLGANKWRTIKCAVVVAINGESFNAFPSVSGQSWAQGSRKMMWRGV